MSGSGRRADERPARAGRNPFQVWFVVAAALTGVVALLPLHADRVGVVDRYLPGWALPWYVGLALGGLVTLTGVVAPARSVHNVTKMLGVERVGLVMLTALLLSYGLAVEAVAPRGTTGFFLLGLGVACALRFRQAGRERRVLYRFVQTLVDEETHDVE